MGQTKPAAGLKSLNRAADTLSTLLAQEVKELNERQKAARRHPNGAGHRQSDGTAAGGGGCPRHELERKGGEVR